jgi:hypothetical protein
MPRLKDELEDLSDEKLREYSDKLLDPATLEEGWQATIFDEEKGAGMVAAALLLGGLLDRRLRRLEELVRKGSGPST